MAHRVDNSWLDIHLFSTCNVYQEPAKGFPVTGTAKEAMLSLQEASQDAEGSGVPPEAIATFQRPELKLASPFFLKPR